MRRYTVFLVTVTLLLMIVQIASAHVHSFGPWGWEIYPTCTKEGRQVRVCQLKGCGTHDRRMVNKVPHEYSAATCTEPKTCRLGCGDTMGYPLGHSYSPATCVSPKQCTRCEATSGGLGPHAFVMINCKTRQFCTTCDYVSTNTGPHVYRDGVCKYCGDIEFTHITP